MLVNVQHVHISPFSHLVQFHVGTRAHLRCFHLGAVRPTSSRVPSATSKPTEFRFELLTEAAAHNWSVLKKHDRSLSRALEAQGGSPLQPGSEFRDLSLLEPILGRHPLWPRFRSILDSGSDWALDPVSDESRLDSVTKNNGRGNHKSARDGPEVLKDQVLDDVTRGFALPLPAKVAPLIPGA